VKRVRLSDGVYAVGEHHVVIRERLTGSEAIQFGSRVGWFVVLRSEYERPDHIPAELDRARTLRLAVVWVESRQV
jgi:hypothetical protein